MAFRAERLDETVVTVGDVLVRVSAARIEDAAETGEFDAIVSSDDTELSMSGGVSKAILDAAGPTIREEAAGLVPLRLGEVGVTSGGRLPVWHILLAVTIDHDRGIKPTEQKIRYLGEALFRRCESLRIRRHR